MMRKIKDLFPDAKDEAKELDLDPFTEHMLILLKKIEENTRKV